MPYSYLKNFKQASLGGKGKVRKKWKTVPEFKTQYVYHQ
jgi:hypothetical protein